MWRLVAGYSQILMEPYKDRSAVTDELVDVLLTPLLAEGASVIVFDQLSYSAGPLPEQLLTDPRLRLPVWVCWGDQDPGTPPKKVRIQSQNSLAQLDRRKARVLATRVRIRDAGLFCSDDIPSGTLYEDARRFRG